MKHLSFTAKGFIVGVLLVGGWLITGAALELDWTNGWLYVLALLGAVAQTMRVEGPNEKTNYSLTWFVYGFAFTAFDPAATLFVVVIAHLADWLWHKYPWYIQCFNIGNNAISAFVAGLVFQIVSRGTSAFELKGTLGLVAASLVFVLWNHWMVGLVVKLARGQSFGESGVFEFLTLSLDFTVLSMGIVTALVKDLIWAFNPLALLWNILPLILLYHALRMPRLLRRLQEAKN